MYTYMYTYIHIHINICTYIYIYIYSHGWTLKKQRFQPSMSFLSQYIHTWASPMRWCTTPAHPVPAPWWCCHRESRPCTSPRSWQCLSPASPGHHHPGRGAAPGNPGLCADSGWISRRCQRAPPQRRIRLVVSAQAKSGLRCP